MYNFDNFALFTAACMLNCAAYKSRTKLVGGLNDSVASHVWTMAGREKCSTHFNMWPV